MILSIIFAVVFIYAVARGISNGSSSSYEYVKSIIEKKPKIEIVVPARIDPVEPRNRINYLDYINQREFEEETKKMLEELGVKGIKE